MQCKVCDGEGSVTVLVDVFNLSIPEDRPCPSCNGFIDWTHIEWAASTDHPENQQPRDFEEYQDMAKLLIKFRDENRKLRNMLVEK